MIPDSPPDHQPCTGWSFPTFIFFKVRQLFWKVCNFNHLSLVPLHEGYLTVHLNTTPELCDHSPHFVYIIAQVHVHHHAGMHTLLCSYAYTTLQVFLHCLAGMHTASCRYAYTALHVHVHCLAGMNILSWRYAYTFMQVHIHHHAVTCTLPYRYAYTVLQV